MRARNIKPGFFINEQLAEVDFATRLLFIGLWCYADREGRFEWKPKKIHAAIFPYDHGLDIEQMLCNLMSLHLITCHDMVGHVVNFSKHQRPHPHEARSSLPGPSKTVNENNQLNQCHDMSLQNTAAPLHVTKCQSDIRNPDIMNPDIHNVEDLNQGKKTRTVKTFLSDSDEIRLGEFFIRKIRENLPDAKQPNLQSWASDFDLIIRRDKRTAREIAEMIEWVQKDEFWWRNIMSPKKLRDKWDQLSAKRNGSKRSSFESFTADYTQENLERILS